MYRGSNNIATDSGTLNPGSMQICFSTISSNAAVYATKHRVVGFGCLDSHCLAHDGTSPSQHLKIGHAPTPGRCRTGRSRERAKGSWRGLVKKRAHGAGLPEKSLHGAIEDCRSLRSRVLGLGMATTESIRLLRRKRRKMTPTKEQIRHSSKRTGQVDVGSSGLTNQR